MEPWKSTRTGRLGQPGRLHLRDTRLRLAGRLRGQNAGSATSRGRWAAL